MAWHALVEIDARSPIPAEELRAAIEAHPRVVSVSVNAPVGVEGWRRALAGFGRARPSSALVTLEAAERHEAERIATAAVQEALARVGVEARLRAEAFRRG
jgi:hypothetical protein